MNLIAQHLIIRNEFNSYPWYTRIPWAAIVFILLKNMNLDSLHTGDLAILCIN